MICQKLVLVGIVLQSVALGQLTWWMRQFGTAGNDSAAAIAGDGTAIYVIGKASGVLDGAQGSGSLFVRKYAGDGNLLWTRQRPDDTSKYGAAADATGVYVFNGSSIIKYGAAGNLLWVRPVEADCDPYPGTICMPNAIGSDIAGIYLAGFSLVPDFPNPPPIYTSHLFTTKYDPNGNVIWTTQVGLLGYFKWLTSLAGSTDGVFVSGWTAGVGKPDMGFVTKRDRYGASLWWASLPYWYNSPEGWRESQVHALAADATGVYAIGRAGEYGRYVMFAARYDASGNRLWIKQLGIASSTAVAADATGLYITGSASGIVDGTNQASGGIFIRKYAANGDLLWTTQFGATPVDSPGGIIAGDRMALAGTTAGALAGPGMGGSDAFVMSMAAYTAHVQPPISSDGSTVFRAARGVVPVKFTLSIGTTPTCVLPPATISLYRVSSAVMTSIPVSLYQSPSETGAGYRVDPQGCQYIYNVATDSLGVGRYRVEASIQMGIVKAVLGGAMFNLQ